MRIVGWIVKRQLLLWTRNLRGRIWRSYDSNRCSSDSKEGGGYLMSGSTGESRRPRPVPRAVPGGLIARIAAGLGRFYIQNSRLGVINGVISGGIMGSRPGLLFKNGSTQDK